MRVFGAWILIVAIAALLSACGGTPSAPSPIMNRVIIKVTEQGHAKSIEIGLASVGAQVYWTAEEVDAGDSSRVQVAKSNLSVDQTTMLRGELAELGAFSEPAAGQAPPTFAMTAKLMGETNLKGLSASSPEAARDALAGRAQLSLLLSLATQSPTSPWHSVLYPNGSSQPIGATPPKFVPRPPVMPPRGP